MKFTLPYPYGKLSACVLYHQHPFWLPIQNQDNLILLGKNMPRNKVLTRDYNILVRNKWILSVNMLTQKNFNKKFKTKLMCIRNKKYAMFVK